MQDGSIKTKEVFRFAHTVQKQNGSLVWDIGQLTENVFTGLRLAGEAGFIPDTVSIDTWGVDYVLLDKNKKEILPAYAYRDARTQPIPEAVHALISPQTLYEHTGLQFQPFNTIYQLYCDRCSGKLKEAAYFLLLPAYLSFKLTGCLQNEYTDASTTGLLNARTQTWDSDIIRALELPDHLFTPLCRPGDVVGYFTEEAAQKIGYRAKVLAAPSHDTASAVAATPLSENGIFISSGTWSLIGRETKAPILSEQARCANFTNEGGISGIRFLKNYMGMWLFQSIRRCLQSPPDYQQTMRLAADSKFTQTFCVNDPSLNAPDNMIAAIETLLGQNDLPLGDLFASVYRSLSEGYAQSIEEIEKLTGKPADCIYIVGGGCQDDFLNRLTARLCGRPVFAGPVEATAIGNIVCQMIACGEIADLPSAREIIKQSFHIKKIQA